jgi:hypothetical protein
MKKKKSKSPPKQKKQKKSVKVKPIKKVVRAKPVKPVKKAKPVKKIIQSKGKIISKKKDIKGKPGVKRIERRKTRVISKELKEFLKDQGITLKEFEKQSRKVQKEYKDEFKETRPVEGNAGEWYYPNSKALNKDYKNTKVASYRHSSYDSALKWWKGVTGGAGYFVILRKKSSKTGRELFFVMDIDPNRRRKGTSKKVSDYQSDRALKLEEKFREAEDI